jgi:hypothetical protein
MLAAIHGKEIFGFADRSFAGRHIQTTGLNMVSIDQVLKKT